MPTRALLDNPKEYVKIYGERNTGTNFVQQMIRQNFRCQPIPGTLADACPGYRESIEEELKPRVSDEAKKIMIRQTKMDAYFRGNLWNTLGWKHAVPPIEVILARPDRDNIQFVTVTKNPYAWALSLFRRPYENISIKGPDKFSDFISEPWVTVERDNAPAILASPIELWNIKESGYERLAKEVDVLRCRYEDVLIDPSHFLTSLSNHLEKTNDEFEIVTDAAKERDKGKKDLNYYQDYYLNQRWRDNLNAGDIRLINRFLDRSVVEEAGYEMLTPMTE